MLVIDLDHRSAEHLAVALTRHRRACHEKDFSVPEAILELEQAALRVVSKRQEASGAVTIPAAPHTGDIDDREWLTRKDVCHLTGTSLSTIDRWVSSGRLPSTRQGRLRRIHRNDLRQLLNVL